jgi:hypothetical protein
MKARHELHSSELRSYTALNYGATQIEGATQVLAVHGPRELQLGADLRVYAWHRVPISAPPAAVFDPTAG